MRSNVFSILTTILVSAITGTSAAPVLGNEADILGPAPDCLKYCRRSTDNTTGTSALITATGTPALITVTGTSAVTNSGGGPYSTTWTWTWTPYPSSAISSTTDTLTPTPARTINPRADDPNLTTPSPTALGPFLPQTTTWGPWPETTTTSAAPEETYTPKLVMYLIVNKGVSAGGAVTDDHGGILYAADGSIYLVDPDAKASRGCTSNAVTASAKLQQMCIDVVQETATFQWAGGKKTCMKVNQKEQNQCSADGSSCEVDYYFGDVAC